MARPATSISDPTSLTGGRIDAGARLGWLLRVSREALGVNLAEMSSRMAGGTMPLSVASISSIERSGQRDGRVVDAYEAALDLAVGQLRAPIDTLCRTFDYAPDDRAPSLAGSVDLARLDALLEPVESRVATGGDWLTLARGLSADRVWVVPSRYMRPLVEDLLLELVRSVGTAFVTRYEAVAVLRCGSYADIVEEAVRSLVAEEGAHTAAVNALSAAAERPTPRLLAWTASLLTHESPVLARAAATAIENMRAVGGLDEDEWEVVVPHFLAGFERADQRPGHAETFTTLFKNLPASLRLTILDRLPRPLTPVAGPLSWNADTHNVHYALCDRLSREVTAEVEVSDQPMVARMLFEIIYDFRAPRITTSAFLLMASPLVDALQPRLACLSVDGPDEVTRAGALRGLHHLQVPRGREALQQWFDAARPLTCGRALVVAGNAGLEVPDEVVDLVRDDSELSRSALECLGLTQHPGLALLADDPARPEVVRTSARWWLRTGGRVTV